MGKRRFLLPLLLFCAGIALCWPFRHSLTAQAIASRSPEQAALAAAFLLVLYAVKSLSICIPLSVLAAAGGLLFPLPLALGINAAGLAITHTIPFFLGRRQQDGLEALAAKYPRIARFCRPPETGQWPFVFLLRLAGAPPGDVVSLYLGAAGIPYRTYLSAGLLGTFPRVAASTVLGTALWNIGSVRFWLSLGAGAVMTALSAVLWYFWRIRGHTHSSGQE